MNGDEMPGLIQSVTEESITVDFNHPLAGRQVSFDIEVVAIDPPQEDKHAHLVG
jgi:FKBP-type peptidyl-prolyl cis-trans isomerase SlpA